MPVRITFLSPPPNLSGGCRVIAIHADRLQARGHDVTVVAQAAPRTSLKSTAKALLKGRLPQRRPAGSHYDGMAARLVQVPHGGPLSDEDVPDADVVIATFWPTAFMAAGLSEAKGRKFYFIQHLETHHRDWRHIIAGTYHLPLGRISVAGWIADAVQQIAGGDRGVVVPNSVDRGLFHAPERGRRDRPTVGVMYSEHPFKGFDLAVEAIAMLRRKIPDLQVVSFGTRKPGRSLPLPPGTRFFLAPPQEQLREIYAMCDVFLMPSRSEGFGLPVLEAMACRCPVVATRTGCAPDVIREGVNGHVVDIGSAEGMAGALERVLTLGDDAWQGMSAAALETVSAYSWDDAADRFEAALQQVPSRSGDSC